MPGCLIGRLPVRVSAAEAAPFVCVTNFTANAGLVIDTSTNTVLTAVNVEWEQPSSKELSLPSNWQQYRADDRGDSQ